MTKHKRRSSVFYPYIFCKMPTNVTVEIDAGHSQAPLSLCVQEFIDAIIHHECRKCFVIIFQCVEKRNSEDSPALTYYIALRIQCLLLRVSRTSDN